MYKGTCPICSRPLALRRAPASQCVRCKSLSHTNCIAPHPAGALLPCCALIPLPPTLSPAALPAPLESAIAPPTDASPTLTGSGALELTPPIANPASAKRAASPISPSLWQVAKQLCNATPRALPIADGSQEPRALQARDHAMPDTVPGYFAEFLNSFNAACAQQKARDQEILDRVSLLSDRVAALESRLDARIETTEVCSVRSSVAALTDSATLTDNCEVLITGIPLSLTRPDASLFAAIVTALELPALATQLLDTRPWQSSNLGTARAPSAAASPIENTAGVADATPGTSSAPSAPMSRSFVARLSSAATRDLVISRSARLAKLTCTAIFDVECGAGFISIRPLWPKPVHNLLRKALAKYRTLGYQRPIVRNLCVFMRATRDSPLILIASEAELDALKPLSD